MVSRQTSILSVALGGVISAGASAAPIATSDYTSFMNALGESHVESFEAMAQAPVSALSFSGAASASVSVVGAEENTIMNGKDGYGAISNGPGQFWKLRAGITVIDFDSAWDAFGFWFSDLEGATLLVATPEAGFVTKLDDDNSLQNHFFGIRSDEPFSRVAIAWTKDSGDGIGIDDALVGRMATSAPSVPAPGAALLAAASFFCATGVRAQGRPVRRGRVNR